MAILLVHYLILIWNLKEANFWLPFCILPENIHSLITVPLSLKIQMLSATGYKSQKFYIVWGKVVKAEVQSQVNITELCLSGNAKPKSYRLC